MNTTTTARVTLYTGDGCQQCRMTKRALADHGIEPAEIDVTDRPDIVEDLRELGFRQLPIVCVEGGETWSGFRPDKIAEAAR